VIILKRNIGIVILVFMVCISSFSGCKKSETGASSENKSDSVVTSNDSSIISGSEVNNSITSNIAASNGESSNGSNLSIANSTGTTSKTNTKFTPPIYNLKGATIRVFNNNGFIKDPNFPTVNEGLKNAEKAFNCKFVITEYTDEIAAYNQFVAGYLAGQPNCEVFGMRGYDVAPRYAASGIILDLSKYYDYNSDAAWQNPYVKNIGVFRGKRYGLTYGDTSPGYAIWYNKALFRAANIPDPWTYVKSNTWNWKTFRDVCKKLTRDTNGDNKTDTWAFNSEDPLGNFIITNGANLIDTTTSPAKFVADSSKSVEAIEFYKLLYSVDKVVPDGNSGLNATAFYQMQSGKLAMYPYTVAYGPYLVKSGIKAADLGWVYWPKGNSALNNDYIIPNATQPRNWVLPSNIEKPKEIVAAITYATAFWSSNLSKPVDILSQQNNILNDDQFLDILTGNNKTLFLQGSKNTVYTKLLNYNGSYNPFTEMLGKILRNELSTSTALATYKSKIQALIEADETTDASGLAG
jgi:hypothetical protein